MARHREPWVVIDSRPCYWYYKLAPWSSYKSTGISKRYAKSGRLINRREAEDYAREQWERHKARAEGRPRTLREMLEPYFDYERCPHVQRVLADRKAYTRAYARDQRRRIELYVLADPIADLVATEITPGDLEDWKHRQLARKVGVRTLNMALGALSTAYKEEIHRNPRAIPYDPTMTVGQVHTDTTQYGIYSLTELRSMFAGPDPWGYNPQHPGRETRTARELSTWYAYTFALALFQTGERPSALFRLRWSSLEEGRLTIAETKTGHGRTLPVPAQLGTALDELQDRALRVAKNDWLWGYDDGSPRRYSWFRGRWEYMMKALKLPKADADGRPRSPYSLKRSLITHLVDNGADEILVREWVGHAHGGTGTRVLTPVQARYKVRQSERLEALRPAVEKLLSQ